MICPFTIPVLLRQCIKFCKDVFLWRIGSYTHRSFVVFSVTRAAILQHCKNSILTSSVIPAFGNVCTSCNAAYWQAKSVHTSWGLCPYIWFQHLSFAFAIAVNTTVVSPWSMHDAAVSNRLINIAHMHSTDSSKLRVKAPSLQSTLATQQLHSTLVYNFTFRNRDLCTDHLNHPN